MLGFFMIAEIVSKNKIIVRELNEFDIPAILKSGQVFRWIKIGCEHRLCVGAHFARITVAGGEAVMHCDDVDYFYNYFDFKTDYSAIKAELTKFLFLKEPIKLGGGIRILNGEFVETLISFIISANNNIKRFTKTLKDLCKSFGERKEFNGIEYFAFPTAEALAKISRKEWTQLGAGYRAGYLFETAGFLSQLGENAANNLKNKTDEELLNALQNFKGVGRKVAACVALFCGDFHRLGVCPIDTWISKALSSLSPRAKREFLTHKFAGIGQQYLFYYYQNLGRGIDKAALVYRELIARYGGGLKCGLDFKNEFELLIAIILSAQCTDKKVNAVSPILFGEFPSAKDLARAELKKVEEIIKPLGLYKNKAKNIIECARGVAENFGEVVPNNFADLTSLAGVGRKTANVFLAEAFGAEVIGVDTHCVRIAVRLGFSTSQNPSYIEEDLTRAFTEAKQRAADPEIRLSKINLLFIAFGRDICSAKNPKCDGCPFRDSFCVSPRE
jgi:endonuclease-3